MKKPIRLSHTSTQMYQSCGEKYRLHYQERVRSKYIHSPLFFGKAFDAALSRILLEKKNNLTDEELEQLEKPEQMIFDETFALDGQETNVNARYSSGDCDDGLLTDSDIAHIAELAEISSNGFYTLLNEYKNTMAKKEKLSDEDQMIYNAICWHSMKRKAHLLLACYRETILPTIEEVFDIQKQILFQEGNEELIGYIDIIASFKDEPGKKYIIDNKTSSKAYKADSVKTSVQLATYCAHEGIYDAAYIVIEKTLRKRAPIVRINVIKDKIDQSLIDETFNNISQSFEGIGNSQFEKNKDSCYAFGRKCDFYGLCHFGSKQDVVFLDNKENPVYIPPEGESK